MSDCVAVGAGPSGFALSPGTDGVFPIRPGGGIYRSFVAFLTRGNDRMLLRGGSLILRGESNLSPDESLLSRDAGILSPGDNMLLRDVSFLSLDESML